MQDFVRKPRSLKDAVRHGVVESALVTCALIAGVEVLLRYGVLKIPNPPTLVLIAVIYSGYSAGLRAGLLSAALAVLYGLLVFSAPGALLQYQGDDATRMAVLALVAPFLGWMTGALKDRTERAARDSEARYRTLTELSSDWYWEQDKNFRFVDISGEVLRAAGSSIGSHIGKTRWELPTVGVSEEDWTRHRAILEAHQPFRDFTFQRVNEAGETIWMSISGVPVFDAAGRFKGYCGVARNVTERMKAEEAVRDSEARFRGAFQLGLIGMALTSPGQGLIEVNDALCRMLGYSREQLLGTTWIQHTHPDDVAANLAILERALAGETDTYGMQKRFLHADGGIVHAEIAASCMRNPDGSARYFVLMIQDISERKQAEVLRQANETLERSNIELQRFVYIASHDLQTPMRSVASFVELLQSTYADRLDAQAKDWFRRVSQSIQDLRNLVRDLLEYSRIDSQAHPFEEVSLREAFDHAITLLDASIRESGAEVTCGPLPTIRGERSQLVQLMLNLVGNALKYRGVQPPRIEVLAQRGVDQWTISVRDNGIGIAPRHHARIFEIFERLHGQQEYPGTGIGLAICRRIVDRHGGRIWVESEPGRGSVFLLTLPQEKRSSQ